jgi:hypothetical protein
MYPYQSYKLGGWTFCIRTSRAQAVEMVRKGVRRRLVFLMHSEKCLRQDQTSASDWLKVAISSGWSPGVGMEVLHATWYFNVETLLAHLHVRLRNQVALV